MMGSSRACCLVGSEMTLLREFRISISFKLCSLEFKRSSFMSPKIHVNYVPICVVKPIWVDVKSEIIQFKPT